MPIQVHVSNLEELEAALAKATGGETILLESGNYGEFYIGRLSGYDITFDTPVSLVSADPGDPAIFSGVRVFGAENLIFDGILFDYTFQDGDKVWEKPFHFADTAGITIVNSVFDGDFARGISAAEDGYASATGLRVDTSQGFALIDSEITGFNLGLSVNQVRDVTVVGNELHSLRKDGMNFADVQSVLIEGNHVHDFVGRPGSEDHRDMIQFWTNGTDSPTTDVIIRGNYLDIGGGEWSQSIFMRNEMVDTGLAGEEMFYRNILIEENVIVNAHIHGIRVGEADGVTIRNNSVLYVGDDTDPVAIPKISVAEGSKDVLITSNATSGITGFKGQEDWTLDNNVLLELSNTIAETHYNNVFVASSLQIQDGGHAPVALPGSVLYIQEAGAAASRSFNSESGPLFHYLPLSENEAIYDFVTDPDAYPEGTAFTWTFSDGFTAEGTMLQRAFTDAGVYEAVLVATPPSGSAMASEVRIEIAGSKLLETSSSGQILLYNEDNLYVVTDSGFDVDGSVTLNRVGPTARIPVEQIQRLAEADEFTLSMLIEPDGSGLDGHIFRLHQHTALSTHDNHLLLSLTLEDGTRISLMATEPLQAGSANRVEITLLDGTISLLQNGVGVASKVLDAPLNNMVYQDFFFGTPWAQPNFGGTISAFEITVNASQYAFAKTLAVTPVAPVTIEETPQDLIAEALGVASVDLSDKSMSISRSLLEEILGVDTFDISFDLASKGNGDTGEVARLHQAFTLTVKKDGELGFWARQQDGEAVRMVTSGAGLDEAGVHEIDIRLRDDALSIFVNDDLVGSAVMTDGLKAEVYHDLFFGNPWGQDNFDGIVSNFSVAGLMAQPPVSMLESELGLLGVGLGTMDL